MNHLIHNIVPDAIAHLESMEMNIEENLEKINTAIHATPNVGDVVKMIVSGADQILKFVDFVAGLHPAAKIVHGAVTKIIALVKTHHENDIRIIRVHLTIVNTVCHLKSVPHDKEDHDLNQLFTNTVQEMTDTIDQFVNFVEQYYRACPPWRKIFKVLLSSEHEKTLEELNDRFKHQRKELDRVSTAKYRDAVGHRLDRLQEQNDEILNILHRLDPGLFKGAEFVRTHGLENVLGNGALLDTLAMDMQECITHSMRETLQDRDEFQKMLQTNSVRCEMRLAIVKGTVLGNFDEGLHELVDNEFIEVRSIWQKNSWKSSIKSRVFVEALHVHYLKEFSGHGSGTTHYDDAWTVEIFSRAMYHSAIGDFVDEDASGFITASEINDFCKARPRSWTIAQWFAFCARGWASNSTQYYRHVESMLSPDSEMASHIQQQCKLATHGQEHTRWQIVHDIIDSLRPLLLIEDLDDLPNASDIPQLQRLQDEYMHDERKKISDNLVEFDYHLDNRSAVAAVMGDPRVELHIMCLIDILTTQLHDTVDNAVSAGTLSYRAFMRIEELAKSCLMAFLAFQRRMQELVRGWRAQGHDVGLQVDRYADGLFRNAIRQAPERQKAANVLCHVLFGQVPSHCREVIDAMTLQVPPKSRVNELTAQVTLLAQIVKELQAKLDDRSTPSTPESRPSLHQRQSSEETHVEEKPKTHHHLHLPQWLHGSHNDPEKLHDQQSIHNEKRHSGLFHRSSLTGH